MKTLILIAFLLTTALTAGCDFTEPPQCAYTTWGQQTCTTPTEPTTDQAGGTVLGYHRDYPKD